VCEGAGRVSGPLRPSVRALAATLIAALLITGLLLAAVPARAGHELTFYPSYYPHEIDVRFVASAGAAAAMLRKNTLHAWMGGDPFAPGAAPPTMRWAESLRGFVVLTFPRAAGAFADADSRCAAAAQVTQALGTAAPFVAHPYAVTPFHDDYVFHADLIQKSRERASGKAPRVRASGALASALAKSNVPAAGRDADAVLEEVELSTLLTGTSPWMKKGWFQAWLLQSSPAARSAAAEAFRRRVDGDWRTPAERVSLERRIVTQALARCERVVLGYTLRREPLNDDYAEGIENVAADSQAGIASPIFIRTVKLKDFPWNGWLRVGVPGRPRAAWNPIGGFTDPAGRLVWSAVGDDPLLLDPDSARIIPNRARPVAVSEVKDVPPDALLAGTLKPAGPGVAARTRILYRVLLSKTHDDQRMTVADIVYPYAQAARDGVAAVRVLGVHKEVKDLGDMQLLYDVPEVEVYLKTAVDAETAPALAPPWSAVPWPVLVLMEQASARGIGAFSEREAARRGVPWLDLARDPTQRAALARLAAELQRRAFVPEPLRPLVTPEQARQRWAALREFARTHNHWLVTAGPYVLGKVTPESASLVVFRDFTYPLGVGSFDQYPIPLRAFIVKTERRGDRLEIQADVENIEKAARSYKIVREPFRPQPASEKTREPLTVHWAVVGPDDDVVAAGASRDVQNGRLVVDPGRLRPGAYRVLLALALNGNLVNPEVKLVPYRVPE
jgi:hypothetical protein